MYTHVTIRLRYGRIAEFLETMPKVQAIAEQAGWALEYALMQMTGELYTMRHLWKMRDMNHFAEGCQAVASHPDYPVLSAVLAEVVVSEEVVFAVHAPYSPGARPV